MLYNFVLLLLMHETLHKVFVKSTNILISEWNILQLTKTLEIFLATKLTYYWESKDEKVSIFLKSVHIFWKDSNNITVADTYHVEVEGDRSVGVKNRIK